ncbi:flagellar basal body P-ring formation chaperone FlgA [Salinibacter grassmerensis]|uniref:flagellar basal body P-ring formation chaperone FlgA n=1 Tax=Salinibacter grassmerensis TaxID=3040353 RepID=UPI0021E932EA|nr:flagellar basal body P-ring formation chaperone FlgA [Salinibacter grassmerensis]
MQRFLVFGLLGLIAASGPQALRAQDSGAEAAVQRAATQKIAARHPESADHLEVRVRRVRGTVDSTAQLRLELPDRGIVTGGLTRARVRARTASGWGDAGWAMLRVTRYDSVLTTRSRIEQGESIGPDDVSRAWMSVSDLHGDPLRASKFRAQREKGTLVADRYLRSERVLRTRDVRPPYAVDPGTDTDMYYRRGRVSFRLSCTVRETGFVEDVVRVYCPDTRKTYQARVRTEEAVEWVKTL